MCVSDTHCQAQLPSRATHLPRCRMDKLRALGCCHIYSARDYTLEGEGRGSGSGDGGCGGGAVPVGKKGGGLEGLHCPPSPPFITRWVGVG